jgi:hypothetical protein
MPKHQEAVRSSHVDLISTRGHISRMNFDISHLLEHWDYQPGQVVVRKFVGKDGQEKIQLRVDLGLLQMNAQGRPDGKRPFGHPTLFDFYLAKLQQHRQNSDDGEDSFKLNPEDCARLQLEAFQYHHRYICLLQLEDFAGVLRDASRNLKVFDFVEEYAVDDELSWTLQQFRPQVLMIHTRAQATQYLQTEEFAAAIKEIEAGMDRLRDFYEEHSRHDLMANSPEISALEHWLGEVNRKRPLSRREQLEHDLHDAVKHEDYEKAAKVRDALKKLKPSD